MKYVLNLIIYIFIVFSVSSSLDAKEVKTVAVLPFSVHSAENIDYVRQGILDMLSSRIAVAEKIEVVSRDTVLQAIKDKEGKYLSVADVHALGKKMNVGYVVYGSITKIGNSVSIDGKLIEIATNKAAVSVFTQSQGMDEVILKINDFARNIDNHILGMVPSTFAQVPIPPQTPSVQQAPPDARESEVVSGIKKSKKGTITSIINPDFITGAKPLDRKGFWMSQKYPTEFRGMDIGDVTGDGLNKVVIIDRHNVMIYQKNNDDFQLIQKIPGKSHENYISVDVADINKNGTKEIIISNVVRNTVESFVLEYKEGKFTKIASNLPFFLRIVDTASGPILLGQNRDFEKPFNRPIHEIVWEDGQYKEGKKMQIPVGLSVYGLTIDSITKSGGEKIIAFDDYNYLNIYEPTEKDLMRLHSLTGSDERIWKSEEKYGGSNTSIENIDLPQDADNKYTYLNPRILTLDLNKDGSKEIVVVKNISVSGGIFKNVKSYTASEVHNLSWDGLGLVENWKTRKISGYVADYQFKDIDNDGQNEVVLALILSVGLSVTDRSTIVVYKMNPQANP